MTSLRGHKRATALNLYTQQFPQGRGEAFLEAEIGFLASAFDSVTIFPWHSTGVESREVPGNVEVVHTELDPTDWPPRRSTWPLLRHELKKPTYLRDIRNQSSYARSVVGRMTAVLPQLDDGCIHYSYWLSDWATVLGMLARSGAIDSYFSRAHHYDLYDERNRLGYQPYRALQVSGLDTVFAVSEVGADYLRRRLSGTRVERAYLGSADHGMGPIPDGDRLRVISVGRVTKVKQLHRIVGALAACTSEISWVHVGDGEDFAELQTSVQELPSNIHVRLLGEVSHADLMALYQNEPFDAFLSVSDSEGLPVSMMEALSFGIPIIGTDVGGVAELVDGSTGIALEAPAQSDVVTDLLDRFRSLPLADPEFRLAAREVWQSNFSAAVNYPKFIERLSSAKLME